MSRPPQTWRRPVLMVCVFVGVAGLCVGGAMAFFGLYAMERMDGVQDEEALAGVLPKDAAPPILELVWSRDIAEPFTGFTLVGPSESPDEILVVLGASQIMRIAPDGRLIPAYELPRAAFSVRSDPAGRWKGFVGTSAINAWRPLMNWVAVQRDLTVWGLDGSELLTLSFEAAEAGPFRPAMGQLDEDEDCEIALFLGQEQRVLDLDGRKVAQIPGPIFHSETFSVLDVDGDGRDELLADGEGNIVAARKPSGETVVTWPLEVGENEFRHAKLSARGPLSFVALGASEIEGGNYRAKVRFFDARGAQTAEGFLPDGARLIYRGAHVAAVDLDRSGVREWAFASQDGGLHFLEHDGAFAASHYTGMRIEGILALPTRDGDLLVTATHRSIVAWRRIASHSSNRPLY